MVVGEIDTQTNSTVAGDNLDLTNTIKLWVAYINSHGGINGHPVKVIDQDDANDPAKSITALQTFVTDDHAVAIFDGSNQDQAWSSFVTEHHVPVISLDTAGDGFQFQTQPYFFANGTTVLTILWGQLKAADVAGAKTFGVIYCAESPACAQAVPAWKALAPSIPIIDNFAAKASNSQPNYTAVCLAAQSAHVQALFPAGVENKRVANDCGTQGYKPIYITSQGTIAAADVTDPYLNNATGDLQDFPWMLDSTPAEMLFHQIENSELAKAETAAAVAFAYVGGQLFAAAATAGVTQSNADPTSQDILNGLYSLLGDTLGGLAPPLTFVPGKANPITCTFLYGVQNGQYVATHGNQTFCQTI